MKMVSDIGRGQRLIYEAFGTEPQYSDPHTRIRTTWAVKSLLLQVWELGSSDSQGSVREDGREVR